MKYTFLLLVFWLTSFIAVADEPDEGIFDRTRKAIERSVQLLETTSASTAEQRKCFTCHGQAMPVIALVEARDHGFAVDSTNLQRQLDHTAAHLRRGRKSYQEGKGQGGGVDTAGYALWTLEAGDYSADEITEPVLQYILTTNGSKGHWRCKSNRPPSESSDYTTTYLAIRALAYYSKGDTAVDQRLSEASAWMQQSEPEETEDRVFHLRSLHYLGLESPTIENLAETLVRSQKQDGGWAQKEGMESDAYATGSVLVALARTQQLNRWPLARRRAIRFLLRKQSEDGSWHVVTRSKPFQEHFESAFPHGKDQFISTSATAWATLALVLSLPIPEMQASEESTDADPSPPASESPKSLKLEPSALKSAGPLGGGYKE